MRPFLPILLLIVAAGGFITLTKWKREKPPKPPERIIQTVETVTLEPETVRIPIQSQGTVEAAIRGNINVEVSGRILSTGPAFKVGGRVRKGDVLLTIDPTAYQVAKARADATLARAKLALLEESTRAEQALKEWEAAKSEDTPEPSPLVLRKPQLELAKAELVAAEEAAGLAAHNLERTQLRAPYDGVLTDKLAEVGQVVAAGTGVPVAGAYSTEALEVSLPVSAQEVTFLEPAQKPSVQLSATIGGRLWTWAAQIERDTGQIDRGTRLHHLLSQINTAEGEESRPELLPGQFVAATIEGKTVAGLYRVPRQAFVSKDEVYLVTEENTLLRRKVHILYRLPDHFLIDQGLNPGERLCLTRLQFMNDGLPVRRLADPQPQALPTPGTQQ